MPPAPPQRPEDAARQPEPEIDPEDVLAPSSPGQWADDARVRIAGEPEPKPEDNKPRERTGMFAKRDKRDANKDDRADEVLAPKSRERSGKDDVRGRIEESRAKPDFRDPDYKPTDDDLDRAREMEKAIRVHKARQARQRAAERRRLERERGKDRDGPER